MLFSSFHVFSYKDLENSFDGKRGGDAEEKRNIDDDENDDDGNDEDNEAKEKSASPSLWRVYKMNRDEFGFLFFGAIGSCVLGVTMPFFAIAYRSVFLCGGVCVGVCGCAQMEIMPREHDACLEGPLPHTQIKKT